MSHARFSVCECSLTMWMLHLAVLEKGITLTSKNKGSPILSASIEAVRNLFHLLVESVKSYSYAGSGHMAGEAVPSTLVYQLVQYMSCREKDAREGAHSIFCTLCGSEEMNDNFVLGKLTCKQVRHVL